MSANDRRHRRLSTTFKLPSLANRKNTQGIALATALLVAMSGFAQQSAPTIPDSSDGSQKAATNNAVTVPAGTRIALVLTQPIQTRYIHRGDDIYAQIVSPVTAGNEVAIPPGTFVQGKVDRLERKGGRGELRLQSMAITFPDGYTMPIPGPIMLESDDGYALKDPGAGRTTGAFALPAAGVGIGALIGHSMANTQPNTITSTLPPGCTGPPPGCLSSSVSAPGSAGKSTVIGAAIGGAVGMVASLALLLNTHNFFLDVGSPVEMVLQQPLSLKQDEVAEAIRDAIRETEHPGPVQAVAQLPRPLPPPVQDNGPTFCETPGTPGTPDIDIPGTPAVGDSPGTPAIHIPGIPATPPTTHLCP
jgi:hypothetical protein